MRHNTQTKSRRDDIIISPFQGLPQSGNLFSIIIPSLRDWQTQFATIVTKTEILKEQYKNSLQELENLYGSLSQKAFKGELGVTQNKTETA